MADYNNIDAQLEALQDGLSDSSNVLSAFTAELDRLQLSANKTGTDLSTLERGLSKGLRRAFDGVILDGMKLSDALRMVGQSISSTAYSAAINPVMKQFSGMITGGISTLMGGVMPFAKGGVVSQGMVQPFAKGGVLDGPVTFPMQGGTGLAGEAGPEAIMPLTRGADGRLGVRAAGGGGAQQITVNISTPDLASFQRSQSQIAAQMSRALQRGQRNS